MGMATRRVSFVTVQMDSKGFSAVLASAVLEWFLIFLLFVHAVFSYLLTKFARVCALQAPCLLCSRLDHILGNERPGFFWDLICNAHKLQISSLAFCRVHDKLADAHDMCETCFSSSATEKKSNSVGRFLVGKLGSDLDCCVDPVLGSWSERYCSCCNDPLTPRLDTPKLLHTESIGADVAEFDSLLPGSMEHGHIKVQAGLKNSRQRASETMRASKLDKHNYDALPHVGYTELKITSDSESEVLFSDEDDGPQRNNPKVDFEAKCEPLDPPAIHQESILSNDLIQDKLVHPMPERSDLVPNVLLDVSESNDLTSSSAAIGHGLENLNWHPVEQKTNPSALTELISLHDVPLPPKAAETVGETSGENLDPTDAVEIEQTSIIENEKVCQLESGLMAETGPCLKIEQILNEPAPPISSLLDLNDAYKLVVKNKGAQASTLFAEQISKKDSSRASEDLKLLLSQVSSARGLELPLSEISPRMLWQGEELKISDASSPIGMHILQKRISIERNESGFESLDGSIVSEIEGETVVDRLKRQVEYDRKSMSALYKELEEERNAAAVAANQALAMITRLQEEKATLQMEALQYLRMMEEQAEYDMEALQKANELLAEKEKEVQDLEAEIEIYRKNSPCEPVGETVQDRIFDLNGISMRVECPDASCISNVSLPTNSPPSKNFKVSNEQEKINAENEDKNISFYNESLVDLEDERLYISQCLKKLEQKLHLFSNSGICMDNTNGGYAGKETNGINDLEEPHYSQGYTQMEEDGFMDNLSQYGRGPLVGNHQFATKENHNFVDSLADKEADLVSLGNEFLDLNERLNALEADQNFLEHVINSLRNSDAIQFIHEIALHLRELRGLGIRSEKAFL